jgi:Ser/Thr protein kinase RdoA (MazF antagonist)
MEALISPATAMPTGPRAALSPTLLDTAREGWGLGAIVELTELADVGGTYNLNVRLQTDRGDVVMRVYRPWVRPERLASVQALRESLWQLGIPVITPLVRLDGSTAMTWDDRLIEIEPWVSSDGGADSWDRYQAAAVQLGSLHVALRQVRLPLPFVGAPVSNVLSEKVFEDWLARTRRAVVAAPQSLERRAALRACDDAGWLRRRLRAFARPHPMTQLTHGDFGHDNVRFFGPTPVAILDFDFADRRDRLTDVAYLIYWMFEQLQWDRPAALRDWRQVSGIIHGYGLTAGIPLTPDEIRSLPLAMATIPLNWVAEAWLMDDPVAALGLVTPQLATAHWLLANQADLAAMWAGDQR